MTYFGIVNSKNNSSTGKRKTRNDDDLDDIYDDDDEPQRSTKHKSTRKQVISDAENDEPTKKPKSTRKQVMSDAENDEPTRKRRSTRKQVMSDAENDGPTRKLKKPLRHIDSDNDTRQSKRSKTTQDSDSERDPSDPVRRCEALYRALINIEQIQASRKKSGRRKAVVRNEETDRIMHPYSVFGRHSCRIVSPFVDFYAVFRCGLTANGLIAPPPEEAFNGMSEEEVEHLTNRLTRFYDICLAEMSWLKQRLLEFVAYVDEIPDEEDNVADRLLRIIGAEINSENQKGRGSDTDKVNKNILDWLPKDRQTILWTKTTPPPRSKSERGFHNAIIARLILPMKWLDQYDEDPERVRLRIQAGEEDWMVYAHDLPVFLYDEEERSDDSDRWDGLCRGHILERAIRAIYFGAGFEASKKGRASVGEKFNMMKITGENIAYAATQVRFALSPVSEWGYAEDLFNFDDFFHTVLELFSDKDDPWATETLAHYNNIFFSNKAPARRKKGAHHPPPKPDSDLVLMRKECEARVNATKLKASAEGQDS